MNAVGKGIAHVSFAGGGVFLPARNPYDRQVLMEHVNDRVRAKGQVQVLMQDRLWIIHRTGASRVARCARCGTAVATACYSNGYEDVCYCIGCALGAELEPVPLQRGTERRVG